MFESPISAAATENLFGLRKPHAQTVAWSYDTWKGMRKFSLKDVVSWQLRKVEQLYKVSSLCLDDQQFKHEELESV